MFSPDGTRLASVGRGYTIHIWEVCTGKLLHRLPGHQGRVKCLAFSTDGKILASGGLDTTVLLWDIEKVLGGHQRIPNKKVSANRLEALWKELADADAAQAFRAMIRLAEAPKTSVSFFKQHLKPVPRLDAREKRRVARFLAHLNSEKYSVRKAATRELDSLDDWVEPLLEKILVSSPSLEVRRRVNLLLAKRKRWFVSQEDLRILRAMEVLEQIGSPEARAILSTLGTGEPRAWLTQEANAALQRLNQRTPQRGRNWCTPITNEN
jgi:hypothetical protein